ncbi:energy transducer TonB [Brevundimonas sp.]|uniref:energy transducer TonB n=1 Tax=Brevundimonas sp. TaxID=1871086 RepID=UPI0035B14BBC
MIAAAFSSAVLALAASEQRDWPSAGGFDILQMEDGCALEADYPIPGRSPVNLSVWSDGDKTMLAMTSIDWSARDGERYDLRFQIGGWVYTGRVRGIVTDFVKKGFVASFEQEFLEAFAAAPNLFVTRDDAVVANLSLQGTAAATSVLRRCITHVARSNAEQSERERRFDYIAADPFAAPSADQAETQSEEPAPAVITNVSWARQPRPEFPARALERGTKSASVTLQCVAQTNGSLASCSIVSESPAGEGFGREAIRAASRAMLSPKTADQAPATVRFVVSFNLL